MPASDSLAVLTTAAQDRAAEVDARQPPHGPRTIFRILKDAIRHPGRTLVYLFDGLVGAVTIICGLGVLATVPILQFLSLGYLLKASARVAKTGKLRAAWIGLPLAARLGTIVACTWLWMWVMYIPAKLARAADLIEPGGPAAARWGLFSFALFALILMHVTASIFRGGRLRHFVLPRPILTCKLLFNRNTYANARDRVWEIRQSLNLSSSFWLGLRGFLGGLLWLIIPVTMIAMGRAHAAWSILGGLLLAFVVLYLPFAQTRFAIEDRMAAMFDRRALRQEFARAPIAFFIAILATLALALPLYLFKIEILPREAAWLPSIVFVAMTFPARVLVGWAMSRGMGRESPRVWPIRHGARLAMIPVVLAYAVVVYFSQYVSWYGIWSLYEQHAFLLPVPFLAL